MHILLYVIGVMATLVGIGAGVLLQQLNMIANGLLIGVLFGTLGKALHLLQKIENHLRVGFINLKMADSRWETLLKFGTRELPHPPAAAATKAESDEDRDVPPVVDPHNGARPH
ncbi:MAG: hypothetical protein E6R12_03340 [Sphingomonadales bacterium]|nr:MAG: hypothetical protein E6R12_03340 [Sphingomonadales bacterium]